MKFSPDQEKALDAIMSWSTTEEQILTFGGLAGTGKTTIIKEVVRRLSGKWVGRPEVVAPTGKAVAVLKRKGLTFAQTLHGLIYLPVGENEDGDPLFRARGKLEEGTGLVIVDEASMINKYMHDDLERLAPKILYVGDHGQLEPVGYDPGLMKNPTIRLEKIHRQASGSPIIQFAHALRQGKHPYECETGDTVQVREEEWPEDFTVFDVIIVSTNAARHKMNKVVREARGFVGDVPCPGETLICLQNNKDHGVYNGLQVVVEKVLQMDASTAFVHWTDYTGMSMTTKIYLPQLGNTEQYWREKELRERYTFFDWGYALTAHKSQGSGFDKVCVLESTHASWNPARWRYTAATRAAQELTYVVENRRRRPSTKKSWKERRKAAKK